MKKIIISVAAVLLLAGLSSLVLASNAFAVEASVEQIVPTVGHLQGACVQGVCSQWRADVWIFNPSIDISANVSMEFRERGVVAGRQAGSPFTVQPGETQVFTDVVLSVFGLDGKAGAIYVSSDIPVAVTGRSYDANVNVLNKGVGTAGQFFSAVPVEKAIGLGESLYLPGLSHNGSFRSNFAFVEVNGAEVTVKADVLDSNGNMLASKQYQLLPLVPQQFAMTDIGITGQSTISANTNQQIRLTVIEGSGRVVACASLIDNVTGDPSTVDSVSQLVRPGVYVLSVNRTSYNDPSSAVAGYVTFWVQYSSDGKLYNTAVWSAITLECNGFTAIPPMVGGWFDLPGRPFDNTDGCYGLCSLDHSYSSPPSVDLINGDKVSWTFYPKIQFSPNGTVAGTLDLYLQSSTGVWRACYNQMTSYTVSGGWVGPIPSRQ